MAKAKIETEEKAKIEVVFICRYGKNMPNDKIEVSKEDAKKFKEIGVIK